MASKSLAKQAVAREACIRLHKKGALDDHLYPVKSDSENESDDKTDGPSQPKTGTRKRKRPHVSQVNTSFTLIFLKRKFSKYIRCCIILPNIASC